MLVLSYCRSGIYLCVLYRILFFCCCFLYIFFFVFFFFFSSRRRHTRCLSDWSSDVCSSDLQIGHDAATDCRIAVTRRAEGVEHDLSLMRELHVADESRGLREGGGGWRVGQLRAAAELECQHARSEERRVGKECRSRWSEYT